MAEEVIDLSVDYSEEDTKRHITFDFLKSKRLALWNLRVVWHFCDNCFVNIFLTKGDYYNEKRIIKWFNRTTNF